MSAPTTPVFALSHDVLRAQHRRVILISGRAGLFTAIAAWYVRRSVIASTRKALRNDLITDILCRRNTAGQNRGRRRDQRRCQRGANCGPLEGGRILPSHRQIRWPGEPDRSSVHERFSIDKFPECFKEYADMLSWDQYWHTTLDTNNAPFWKWFVGGKLNACYNCVDRHLPKYRNKAALIFVPEPEEEGHQAITYQELCARVNEVAAMLRDFAGLKAGDRVTHSHSDGSGTADDDAGLRAARSDSFGGVRRIQRRGLRNRG